MCEFPRDLCMTNQPTRLQPREQTVRSVEIDRVLAVFDVFDEELDTPASKFKYLEDTRRFYGYLIDAGRAVYNLLDRMATQSVMHVPVCYPDSPTDSTHSPESIRRDRCC